MERARESERERLCPSVKQCKHRNGIISIIQDLHISLSIVDCTEREQEWERERQAMFIHEMVKTQKWYYIHNMRSGYFPINRRLHKERERESKREKERLCPTMKWWKHRNCTLCVLQDLYISLSIGDCIEKACQRERERESADRLSEGHRSDNLCGYFIWKFEHTSDLGHFIWQVFKGVYLTKLST